MQTSRLLSDEVRFGKNRSSAWLKRILVEFENDEWIAIGDPAAGQRIGAARVRDRGVPIKLIDRFPSIPAILDGTTIGARFNLDLRGNTVYLLAAPLDYVADFIAITLDGIEIRSVCSVASDYRLVYAAHARSSGILEVQARLLNDTHAFAEKIQESLSLPTPEGPFSRAGSAIRNLIVSDPSKVVDTFGSMLSLFGK